MLQEPTVSIIQFNRDGERNKKGGRGKKWFSPLRPLEVGSPTITISQTVILSSKFLEKNKKYNDDFTLSLRYVNLFFNIKMV